MYIAPSTTIKLLTGIKLDLNYMHSIVFDDRSAQLAYFNSKVKYTLTSATFQRVTRNKCRVNVGIDNLYSCNYMMFNNSAYSGKWFYAFITNAEYVNNDVTEITYELDVIQTWLLDCNLTTQFFIEREHTSTDNLYEHHVPEEFNTNDYVTILSSSNILTNSIEMNFVAMFIVSEYLLNGSWVQFKTGLDCNIVTKIFFVPFHVGNAAYDAKINDFIKQYESAGKIQAILGVYTIPSYVLDGFTWSDGQYLDSALIDYTNIIRKIKVRPDNIDGYVPKNKKLFNAPFVVVELTNNCGSSQLYKPESLFIDTDGSQTFIADCSYMPNGEIHCRPLFYENDTIYNMSVVLSNYPQGIISYDYFQNWWASEKIGYMNRTVNTLFGGGTGIVSKAIMPTKKSNTIRGINSGNISTLSSLAADGISEIGKIEQAEIVPSPTIGNANSFNMNIMISKFDFNVNVRCIKSDIAESIDNYFSLYGYRVDRLKTLELSNRPQWHYVKTRNANFIGSMPQEYREAINDIFDRGITFWRHGDNIGLYTLDNSAVFE